MRRIDRQRAIDQPQIRPRLTVDPLRRRQHLRHRNRQRRQPLAQLGRHALGQLRRHRRRTQQPSRRPRRKIQRDRPDRPRSCGSTYHSMVLSSGTNPSSSANTVCCVPSWASFHTTLPVRGLPSVTLRPVRRAPERAAGGDHPAQRIDRILIGRAVQLVGGDAPQPRQDDPVGGPQIPRRRADLVQGVLLRVTDLAGEQQPHREWPHHQSRCARATGRSSTARNAAVDAPMAGNPRFPAHRRRAASRASPPDRTAATDRCEVSGRAVVIGGTSAPPAASSSRCAATSTAATCLQSRPTGHEHIPLIPTPPLRPRPRRCAANRDPARCPVFPRISARPDWRCANSARVHAAHRSAQPPGCGGEGGVGWRRR